MSLYYCLANTVVNGEIVIQGSSVTYSASASALDSSDTSFDDAAKVATINSNTAAIIAARKTIDDILVQYSYVLSDTSITSMINNSLNTNITRIFPRYLDRIANTVDGITYILKKNTTIAENQYLLIPNGKRFFIPEEFKFTNKGIFQIGVNRADKSGLSAEPSSDKCTTIVSQQAGSRSGITNNGPINIAVGACFTVYSASTSIIPIYRNQGGTITNNGQFVVSGVNFANQASSGVNGVLKNTSTGTYYSDLSGTICTTLPLLCTNTPS